MKAITKKLLIAGVTVGILIPLAGVFYAVSVEVQLSDPLNNAVEVISKD